MFLHIDLSHILFVAVRTQKIDENSNGKIICYSRNNSSKIGLKQIFWLYATYSFSWSFGTCRNTMKQTKSLIFMIFFCCSFLDAFWLLSENRRYLRSIPNRNRVRRIGFLFNFLNFREEFLR